MRSDSKRQTADKRNTLKPTKQGPREREGAKAGPDKANKQKTKQWHQLSSLAMAQAESTRTSVLDPKSKA